MVVKVYISGISGNKEVKKRQQRVILILESKNIKYELLDIAEPNMEEAKEYMQNNSKEMGGTISDPNPRHPLPPQLFNDDEYCGDYDSFDMANEIDEMGKFLKLGPNELPPSIFSETETKVGNGEVATSEAKSKEGSQEKETADAKENGEAEAENETENVGKEKSPSPSKDKSPAPEKEKSASPEKEKSPSPEKEKSPSLQKEKSPSIEEEQSPTPEKEKSPSIEKEKSATPEKEKSPSPAKDDNATDDQKTEAKESEEEEEEEE